MKSGFTVQKGGAIKRKVKRAQPADIHSVYDSGDGYIIVMTWPNSYPGEGMFESLVLSENPGSPGGISQFSGARVGPHLGKQIAFHDLPQNVQEHAIMRLSSKEVRSQAGDAVNLTVEGGFINDAMMILQKAYEYANNGETAPALAICGKALDFLTTAIELLTKKRDEEII